MPLHGFRTELGHLSKHSDALSVCFEFDKRVQGGFGRIWIGVVAIVDKLDAVNVLDLQAGLSEGRCGETGGTFLQRKSKNTTGRDRQKRVLHHMYPRHREHGTATMCAF